LLYAQTGFALGNQSLKVNFGGPVSRHSDTTPGYTIGAGAEWRLYDGPTGVIGQSPSLFVEYSHIFWGDAHFNTPAASPAFNYTWSRESNVIKGGLRVRF
jgi:opacity protein-like surface antigen